MGYMPELLDSLSTILLLNADVHAQQKFKTEIRTTEAAIFLNCRIEDCQLTGEGALVSSGNNELYVEMTDFINCSSKTECGGLKKTDGKLIAKCCFFEECHAEGGDNSNPGTAMGTYNCESTVESLTFYRCWIKASPCSDSVYGFSGGTSDVMCVNCSRCISRGGGLVGCFNSVSSGAIRCLQGVDGEEHNSLEIWYTEQTINFMNVINNTLINDFIVSRDTKLMVRNGCFFLNSRYNNNGLVEMIDCVSDSHPKATTYACLTSLQFVVKQCRMSSYFTCRGKYKFLIYIFHLLL